MLLAHLEEERIEVARQLGARIRRVVDLLRHVDIDAAQLVDHVDEAFEVDDHIAVCRDTEVLLHHLLQQRGPAAVVALRLAGCVDRVDAGLVGAVAARERHVHPGVAGNAQDAGSLAPRVDRDHEDGVGAGGCVAFAGPPVQAHHPDVDRAFSIGVLLDAWQRGQAADALAGEEELVDAADDDQR